MSSQGECGMKQGCHASSTSALMGQVQATCPWLLIISLLKLLLGLDPYLAWTIACKAGRLGHGDQCTRVLMGRLVCAWW